MRYENSFIPESQIIARYSPNSINGVQDEREEILRALSNPVGTESLSGIVRKKRLGRDARAVIVVNDITRPTPSRLLVPPLLEELNKSGVEDARITILVATGSHRPNTEQELRELLSPGITARIRTVNHDGSDESNLVNLGRTSRGVPVVINRLYSEADIKILTGSIIPHQSAGFSGGRKSIIPGIAGRKALMFHHSHQLRYDGPAMGIIEGNHFSDEALEAAGIAGVDFILNVVQNSSREVVCAVAGDVEKAWLAGVAAARGICEVKTSGQEPDVVISYTGGAPRNINLYQTQKAVSPAEKIIRKGGIIIVVSDCSEGIGGGRNFYEWLAEAENPREVIERFKTEGYSESSNKAFLYARALEKAEIVIVTTNLTDELAESMFLKRADTVEQAFAYACEKLGKHCKVAIMENAPELVPVFK